jgi:hypothetical protein
MERPGPGTRKETTMKGYKQGLESILDNPDKVQEMAEHCGLTVDKMELYLMKWLDEGQDWTDADWERHSFVSQEVAKVLATRDAPPGKLVRDILTKADFAKIKKRVKAREAAARETDPDLN